MYELPWAWLRPRYSRSESAEVVSLRSGKFVVTLGASWLDSATLQLCVESDSVFAVESSSRITGLPESMDRDFVGSESSSLAFVLELELEANAENFWVILNL